MPDSLDKVASELEQLLHRAIRTRMLWQIAAWGLGIIWLVMALDRWLIPSVTTRALSALGLVVLGLCAWFRYGRPMLRPVERGALYGLLARVCPEAADPLFMAITPRSKQTEGSKEADTVFREASRRDAIRAVAKLDLRALVPSTSRHAAARLTALAWCGTISLGLLYPESGGLFLRRMALSAEPWPQQVRIVPEGFALDPSGKVWQKHVAKGEPIELVVWANFNPTRRPPPIVRVWSDHRPLPDSFTRVGTPSTPSSETATESSQRYLLRLEGLVENLELLAWGGDDRIRLRLLTRSRPAVMESSVVVVPPTYFHQGNREMPTSLLGPVPEGASINLQATASAPLASAHAIWNSPGAKALALPTTLGNNSDRIELTSPPLLESGSFSLHIVDQTGIEGESPFVLPIVVQADEPPSVALRLRGRGRLITPRAQIPLQVTASDDHGLASLDLRLTVKGDDTPPLGEEQASRAEPPFSIDLAQTLRGSSPYRFVREIDLAVLFPGSSSTDSMPLHPGRELIVRGVAQDHYPLSQRSASLSEPLRFQVVEPDVLMAHLALREQRLRLELEGTLADVRRLAYALQRGSSAEGRGLDTSKIHRSVLGVVTRCQGIRDEVVQNRLEQPALIDRLESRVIQPLTRTAEQTLAPLAQYLQQADPTILGEASPESFAHRAADQIAAVIEAMQSNESYNELVASLRELVRKQRRMNQHTEKERRETARRLLLE